MLLRVVGNSTNAEDDDAEADNSLDSSDADEKASGEGSDVDEAEW